MPPLCTALWLPMLAQHGWGYWGKVSSIATAIQVASSSQACSSGLFGVTLRHCSTYPWRQGLGSHMQLYSSTGIHPTSSLHSENTWKASLTPETPRGCVRADASLQCGKVACLKEALVFTLDIMMGPL